MARAGKVDGMELEVGEGAILLLAPFYDAIGQGTWGIQAVTSYFLCGYLYNSSGDEGDNVSWSCYLAPGTYTVKIFLHRNAAGGLWDIEIEGETVTSFDAYSASLTYNEVFTQAGVVVTKGGLKTITLRNVGTSVNKYKIYFGAIVLYRTA